jgi:hypothetical protein
MIANPAFRSHAGSNRDFHVGVIIYDHLALCVVEPMTFIFTICVTKARAFSKLVSPIEQVSLVTGHKDCFGDTLT